MACVAVPCSLPITTGTGIAVEIVDACETDGTGGCMEDVVGTTAEGRKADGGDGSSMGDVVGMWVGGCYDDPHSFLIYYEPSRCSPAKYQ